MKEQNALKTIGEVVELVGVEAHVLRFWESKFNQINPQKRRGRRYYKNSDINSILKIKSLLYDSGFTIKGVRKYLRDNAKNLHEIDLLVGLSVDSNLSASKLESTDANKESENKIAALVEKTALDDTTEYQINSNLNELLNTNLKSFADKSYSEAVEGTKENNDSYIFALNETYKGLVELKKKLMACL